MLHAFYVSIARAEGAHDRRPIIAIRNETEREIGEPIQNVTTSEYCKKQGSI
jgi:hypothetical protein